MANVSTQISFSFKDLISSPLQKINSAITNITSKFKNFGNDGQKSGVQVKKSIAELETELNNLKSKRYWERDIEEVKKLNSQIKKTENEIKQLNNETGKEGFLKKIGIDTFNLNQITQSVTNFAEGLKQVNQASESFEYVMAKANTMANLSAVDFKTLTNQTQDLAKNVGITRDEIGQGLYDTISQGVPKDNWIDFLDKSSKASVGGVADLSEVVKVTSTIIKNYALDWTKAGDVQDKIQKTVQLGSTTFAEMAQALPSVTGNAATLNVSIDELTGAFATLTGVSGNTSEVSTQLNGIFSALVAPTSQAQQLAKQMGIAFDANSIKRAGGMQPFLKQLDAQIEEYAKKTGQIPAELYSTFFGSQEAMKAILPITGTLAADFEQKTAQMANSAGTIEDAYTQMANTSQIKSIQLQNKIDNLKDHIFNLTKGWMPLINVGTEQLVQLGQMIPALNLFSGLFSKGLGGLKTFAGSLIGKLVPALGAATTAQTGLNVAMLANPIGLIIAAIVAVIAIIVILVKHMHQIEDWFKRQNKIVKGLVISFGVFSWLLGILFLIAKAIRVIIDHWQEIKAKIVEVLQKIVAFGAGIWAVIKMLGGKLLAFLQPIFDWVTKAVHAIGNFFKAVFLSVENFFIKAFLKIKSWIEQLKNWFIEMKDKIVNVFLKVRDFVLNLWDKLKNSNSKFIQALIKPFVMVEDAAKWVWERLKEFFAWLGKIAEKLGLKDVSKTFKSAYDESLENQTKDKNGKVVNTDKNKPNKSAYDESLENQTKDKNGKVVNTDKNKPNTPVNNNVLADNGTGTGGDVGGNQLATSNDNVARVFKITVNFDQNFTIKQESDYNKVKQIVEQTVISAIHDAEIIAS